MPNGKVLVKRRAEHRAAVCQNIFGKQSEHAAGGTFQPYFFICIYYGASPDCRVFFRFRKHGANAFAGVAADAFFRVDRRA